MILFIKAVTCGGLLIILESFANITPRYDITDQLLKLINKHRYPIIAHQWRSKGKMECIRQASDGGVCRTLKGWSPIGSTDVLGGFPRGNLSSNSHILHENCNKMQYICISFIYYVSYLWWSCLPVLLLFFFHTLYKRSLVCIPNTFSETFSDRN